MWIEQYTYDQQEDLYIDGQEQSEILSLDQHFLKSQKEELWWLKDQIEFDRLTQRDRVSLDEDVDLIWLKEEFDPQLEDQEYEFVVQRI